MKKTFTILLSGLIFCGCSQKQATSAGSAIDLIQTGTDTTFLDGTVLHVTKRDGASLQGIQIITTRPDGVKLTYTADTATLTSGNIENPAAEDYVKIVILNAKVEGITKSGNKATYTENVTM